MVLFICDGPSWCIKDSASGAWSHPLRHYHPRWYLSYVQRLAKKLPLIPSISIAVWNYCFVSSCVSLLCPWRTLEENICGWRNSGHLPWSWSRPIRKNGVQSIFIATVPAISSFSLHLALLGLFCLDLLCVLNRIVRLHRVTITSISVYHIATVCSLSSFLCSTGPGTHMEHLLHNVLIHKRRVRSWVWKERVRINRFNSFSALSHLLIGKYSAAVIQPRCISWRLWQLGSRLMWPLRPFGWQRRVYSFNGMFMWGCLSLSVMLTWPVTYHCAAGYLEKAIIVVLFTHYGKLHKKRVYVQ